MFFETVPPSAITFAVTVLAIGMLGFPLAAINVISMEVFPFIFTFEAAFPLLVIIIVSSLVFIVLLPEVQPTLVVTIS